MPEDFFWKNKSLQEMTPEEWESLCDGCAKCCIFKFEEAETGHIMQTDVVCKLLDLDTCYCSRYEQRKILVPDCITISPENILQLKWMPVTCSYRLLALGKELPNWHPLVTGNKKSAIAADKTVQGNVVSETEIDDLEQRIIGWFDPES